MSGWMPQPVAFESSRHFDCEEFTSEECQFYKNRWRNWYVADLTFSEPTVVLFVTCIFVFALASIPANIFASRTGSGRANKIWRKACIVPRYLSYRGFRIKLMQWNSAPLGMLLLGLVGTVYFICMDLIPSPYYWPGTDKHWGNSPPLGTRSGWLALACMPILFATASKANWITLATGVTHEKLQVFHRWIAYAFFVLALMHTFPFIVWHIRNHDMVSQVTVDNTFEYWTGIVTLLIQAILTIASASPFRRLCYEFFKAVHFFSAAIFVVVFFWHCGGTLTSWDYFVATAAVYVPCWAFPILRTVFECGVKQKAELFVEANGFLRITIPGTFDWLPGQHCFLRFHGLGVSAFTSHPFTICSLPSNDPNESSKLCFYVKPHKGTTARLHSTALARPGSQISVLVDGPYGGINLRQFIGSHRLVVIAGGSGAGWVLPLIEQFLRCPSISDDSRRRLPQQQETEDVFSRQPADERNSMRVILATSNVATRDWFKLAAGELLSRQKTPSDETSLDIEVHLTCDTDSCSSLESDYSYVDAMVTAPQLNNSDLMSADSSTSTEKQTVKVSSNEARLRPDLKSAIEEEAAAARRGQKVGVFVCGPLDMQNDVRNAVAKANLKLLACSSPGELYLHMEHFSWA